jgi:hypothetical protein
MMFDLEAVREETQALIRSLNSEIDAYQRIEQENDIMGPVPFARSPVIDDFSVNIRKDHFREIERQRILSAITLLVNRLKVIFKEVNTFLKAQISNLRIVSKDRKKLSNKEPALNYSNAQAALKKDIEQSKRLLFDIRKAIEQTSEEIHGSLLFEEEEDDSQGDGESLENDAEDIIDDTRKDHDLTAEGVKEHIVKGKKSKGAIKQQKRKKPSSPQSDSVPPLPGFIDKLAHPENWQNDDSGRYTIPTPVNYAAQNNQKNKPIRRKQK